MQIQKSILIFALVMFSLNFILAGNLSLFPNPNEPNVYIAYVFNFSNSTTCASENIILTHNVTLLTNPRGFAYTSIDISNLSSVPLRLCEYKDGILRKNHSLSNIVFDTIFAQNLNLSGDAKVGGDVNVTGNVTASTGFFTWLGSLANRITELFVQDINFNGTINGTGNITTTGNISADWFKGKFNWTEISQYLSFDGSTLDFNETELNSTINSITVSTTYNATIITTVDGTLDAGNLASIQTPEDDDTYNVSEDVGADPLTVAINFSSVSSFDSIIGRVYYDGGLGHEIQLEIQRSDTGAWENYIDITDTTDFVNIYVPVFDPIQHVYGNGNVAIRFKHVQNGVPSHNFYIDYLAIVDGWTALTVADHDALGGRDNIENHPWALPTNGSLRNASSVIVTGNVTASYYFGDGSLLTGIEGAFNSTAWNRTGTDVFLHHTGDNVGIGTTSPDNLLHLNGTRPELLITGVVTPAANTRLANYAANSFFTHNAYFDGTNWRSNDPATGSTVINIGAAVWRVRTAAATGGADGDPITLSEKMRVHTDGNVGIGTAAPNAKLKLEETGAGTELKLALYQKNNTNATSHAVVGTATAGASGGDPSFRMTVVGLRDWSIGIDNDDDDKFKIGTSSVVGTNTMMTILSTGQVGIGTSTPGTKLEIQTADGGNAGINLQKESRDATHIEYSISHRDNNKDLWIYGYNGTTFKIPFKFDWDNEYTILGAGGNVGIGTASPNDKLDVDGNARFTDATHEIWIGKNADMPIEEALYLLNDGQSGIVRTYYDTTNLTLQAGETAGFESKIILGAKSGSDFIGLYTQSSERMRISGTGKVGIGTTTPGTTLDVEGNAWFGTTWKIKTVTGNQIDFTRDGVNYITTSNASGSLMFGTGGRTNDVHIDSTGKVGIGTGSPSHNLQVYEDNAEISQLNLEQDGAGDASMLFTLTGLKAWQVGIDNSDSDKFKINEGASSTWADTHFTIDTAGNVGIGTASPQSKLDISSATDPVLTINATSGGAGIEFQATGGDYGHIQLRTSGILGIGASNIVGGDAISIQNVTGNVGIGTASPSAKLAINGGVHVGGDSDPGDNNLDVDGISYIGWEIIEDANFSGDSININCPAGKKLLGGGCQGAGSIEGSYPLDDDTWRCLMETGAGIVEGWAICARVGN